MMKSPQRPIKTPSHGVVGPSLHDEILQDRPAPPHILLAEDEVQVGIIMAKMLRRAGYAVTVAEDGRQAGEALRTGAFDLLITDNDMPRLTGVQLAVQTRLQGMDLPIIIISGNLGKITIHDIKQLQIAALLQKPVILENLLETIARAVGPPNRHHWGKPGAA